MDYIPKCNFCVTISGGKSRFVQSLLKEKLEVECHNRDINSESCQALQNVTPSIDWFKQSIDVLYRIRELDSANPIDKYTNYSSSTYNSWLRGDIYSEASINILMEQFPLIDKDIVVFQQAINIRPTPGLFFSTGYLSTTIMSSGTVDAVKSESERYMMRMKFPAGMKGIWIPSHEYEIIFPHGILFNYVNVGRKDVKMINERSNAIEVVNLPFIDVEYVGMPSILTYKKLKEYTLPVIFKDENLGYIFKVDHNKFLLAKFVLILKDHDQKLINEAKVSDWINLIVDINLKVILNISSIEINN